MKNYATGTVTDLTYLIQVSNGDEHFIQEMISVYLKETPESIENLERHLKNKDWKKFRAVTHKMKPSFSFFGLKELYSVVNFMEEYSGKEIHLDELPKLLMQVKTICGKAMLELERQRTQKT